MHRAPFLVALSVTVSFAPAASLPWIPSVTVTSSPLLASAVPASSPREGAPGVRQLPIDPSRYVPMPLPDPRTRAPAPVALGEPVSYDLRTGEVWVGAAPFPSAGEERFPGSPGPGPSTTETWSEVRNFSDLEIVEDPSLYPWCVNVRLFMQFGSSFYVGSGVLIDPLHVLTAGHCVFDYGGTNDWADDIVVIPAYENGGGPFGWARAASLHSWTGWTQSGSFDHDMGVIDLDRPIGALTGWHGFGYNNNNSFFTGNTFHNPGYPAESPYNGEYLYYWYGSFDWVGTYQLTFFKTAYGGQSGSGAYHINGGDRTVYAVLSNGWALWTNDVRITEAKFTHIAGFIAEDTPSSFDLVAMDVNASPSSVTAGTSLASMDYLVHNYSSASWGGSVPVRVYLSTNDDVSTADTPLQDHSFSCTFSPKSSVRVVLSTPPVIPIGTPSGGYWIGVILNVDDANLPNNESDGQEATYVWVNGGPDLVVQGASADPASIVAGTSAVLGCTVRNQGGNGAGSSVLRYYLSADATYDAGDTFLGSDAVGPLPGGDSSPLSEVVTIPAPTQGGSWYLFFVADATNVVPELNEANNVASLPVTISPENVPPAAITTMQANVAGVDLVLSWTQPWDNVGVVGYWIYHHASVHDPGIPFVYLGGASVLTYTVSGVCGDPAVHHFFDVRARDAAGNIAPPSNWVGEFDFPLGP